MLDKCWLPPPPCGKKALGKMTVILLQEEATQEISAEQTTTLTKLDKQTDKQNPFISVQTQRYFLTICKLMGAILVISPKLKGNSLFWKVPLTILCTGKVSCTSNKHGGFVLFLRLPYSAFSFFFLFNKINDKLFCVLFFVSDLWVVVILTRWTQYRNKS